MDRLAIPAAGGLMSTPMAARLLRSWRFPIKTLLYSRQRSLHLNHTVTRYIDKCYAELFALQRRVCMSRDFLLLVLKHLIVHTCCAPCTTAVHDIYFYTSNPTRGMEVCLFCVCYVLSGRGLCDGLITRPEESYRLWRVFVCDQETSYARRLQPR